MKIIPILLFLLISTAVQAQDQHISLNLRNVSLEEVIRQIETQTPYRFVYRSNEVSNVTNLNVNARNQQVSAILSQVLRGTGLSYTYDNNQIVIVPSNQRAASNDTRYRVTGTVVDEKGQALPGVTVRVKNGNVGVATDMNGKFVINFNDASRPTLVFSFIGYVSQEVSVTGNEDVHVKMNVDITKIEDVVVTGIITRPRESYVGAVTTITKEELRQNYSRNLLQTITDLEPSMRMIQDNVNGSDPNKTANIEIRGAASMFDLTDIQLGNRGNVNMPLFILDGFPVDAERINDLNFDEVESINILKDATATALYGSQGANGVVVITTSVPMEGKLRVSYTASLSLEIPDLSSYNLMSAREKLEFEHGLGLWEYYPELYEANLARVNAGVNTDWLSIPTRTGVGQQHNFSISGGSPEWKVGIDGNYQSIKGVMKGSDRSNFNGTAKISYIKNKWILNNSLGVGYNTSSDSAYDSFANFVGMNRYWEPFDEWGEAAYDYLHPASPRDPIYNPAYNASKNYWKKSKYTNIRNNFSVSYKILPTLTVRGAFGINHQISFSDSFRPPSHQSEQMYEQSQRGEFSRAETVNNQWNAKLQASYVLTVKNDHNFTFDLVTDMEERIVDQANWRVKGFTTDDMDHPSNALGYPDNGIPSGNENTKRRMGVIGAFTYTYKMKYLLDANFNYEGSSSFGKESRWAPFYSVGAGWTASRERFIEENLPFITLLRFKYSVGISGNLNFSPSQAMTVYKVLHDQHYLGNVPAWIDAFGNPGLKWQNTLQHNIGIELSLFDNILNLGFNYYNRTTQNTVSQMDLPISHGYFEYTENVGKIRNTGLEYRAQINLIQKKDFKWSVDGYFSGNKNVLVKLSDALKARLESSYWAINTAQSSNNIYYKIKEGESIDAIYGLRTAGIDPATGYRVYIDKDGNRSFAPGTSEDEVYLGNLQPKLNGNFGTSLYYKGLTVSVNFSAQFGGKQFNQTLMNKVENINFVNNLDRRVLTEKWAKPGDIAAYKGLTNTENSYVTDAFIMRDNVFRCSSINLSYHVPQKFVSNLRITSLVLTANISDVFYLSTIKRERGLAYPFSRNSNFSASFVF